MIYYEGIEAFLEIVKRGSLSAAAEYMYVSQPTLSNRIYKLEHEVGATLIKRGKGIRQIELTAEGEKFLHAANQMNDIWFDTKRELSEQESILLRVCAVHSITMHLLPEVCIDIFHNHPDISIKIETGLSDDIYERVERGTVEAAFTTKTQHSNRIERTTLYHENMLLVCNSESKYGRVIDPSQLSVEEELFVEWGKSLVDWHEHWFGEAKVPRIFVQHIAYLAYLPEIKNLWSVVPETMAKKLDQNESLRICHLTEPPRHRTVYLLTKKGNEPSIELLVLLDSYRRCIIKRGIKWLYDF